MYYFLITLKWPSYGEGQLRRPMNAATYCTVCNKVCRSQRPSHSDIYFRQIKCWRSMLKTNFANSDPPRPIILKSFGQNPKGQQLFLGKPSLYQNINNIIINKFVQLRSSSSAIPHRWGDAGASQFHESGSTTKILSHTLYVPIITIIQIIPIIPIITIITIIPTTPIIPNTPILQPKQIICSQIFHVTYSPHLIIENIFL